MDKKEKEMLVDPGDWYSGLFDGDSGHEKIKPGTLEDTSHLLKVKKTTPESARPVGAYEPQSDRDTILEVMPEEEKNAQRKSRHIPVCIFFSCAVLIFLLCIYYLSKIDDLNVLPGLHFSSPSLEYVSSYLSYSAKQNMYKETLNLLRKKRSMLLSVQRDLKNLEEDKNSFLAGMEKKEKIFLKSRSIFDLTGKEKNMRSIADLIRSDVEFKGEKRRRIQIYLELYNRRKESLLAQKEEYEQNIKALTEYQRAIESMNHRLSPRWNSAFLLNTVRSGYLESFLYSVEHGDYESAVSTWKAIQALGSKGNEPALSLVNRLVLLLQEYDHRLELLRRRSPFEEINLAFLSEDYDSAEKKIRALENEGYLKPILSELDKSLFINDNVLKVVAAWIGQNESLKQLVRKAESYVKKKEYEKALDIYENLLIFRLHSYDREMILNKLHSIWLAFEEENQRREENTQAIKYINSARILGREGKDTDALEYYKMLLRECPNSDYTQDAVEGIIRITSTQNLSG